ncbi:DUF7684 family protein [Coralliovum pocilloporae]|uniref:DUF7684 family protein n=1 Tax=Coralliovum pocilloporae TaxID=3066369 RepID=UPI003306C300
MLRYKHLLPEKDISILDEKLSYKCVLLSEMKATASYRNSLCRQLINSGCKYFMAWGTECETWHDSMDTAVLEKSNYDEVPADEMVITTWHDGESIVDVLRFAKIDACKSYTDEPLNELLVLDTSEQNRKAVVQEYFENTR